MSANWEATQPFLIFFSCILVQYVGCILTFFFLFFQKDNTCVNFKKLLHIENQRIVMLHSRYFIVQFLLKYIHYFLFISLLFTLLSFSLICFPSYFLSMSHFISYISFIMFITLSLSLFSFHSNIPKMEDTITFFFYYIVSKMDYTFTFFLY